MYDTTKQFRIVVNDDDTYTILDTKHDNNVLGTYLSVAAAREDASLCDRHEQMHEYARAYHAGRIHHEHLKPENNVGCSPFVTPRSLVQLADELRQGIGPHDGIGKLREADEKMKAFLFACIGQVDQAKRLLQAMANITTGSEDHDDD